MAPSTKRQSEQTQPAEERGECITGQSIVRGGKITGFIPGVTEQSPASGGSGPEAEQKSQAVVNALVQLGEFADTQRLAEAVKVQTGIDMDPEEVAAIRAQLSERAQKPPGPDQPPPENARGNHRGN